VPQGHIPIINSLVVPIIYQKDIIGLLHVANKTTDYNEKDKALLEIFADHIAPILTAKLEVVRKEKGRKLAEEMLQKAHDDMKRKVKEQTVELIKRNGNHSAKKMKASAFCS
jgi:signal transduction protein with GAF and PtsI domain